METSQYSQPCWLVSIPDELKLYIVSYLDARRDIYNLSRTCRAFEDMTMRLLYYNVDLEVCSLTSKAGEPPLRAPAAQSVRELAIRSGMARRRNSAHNSRQRSNTGSIDSLVHDILKTVPRNQLSNFQFLHGTPLTGDILDTLANRHDSTLEYLALYELGSVEEETSFPSNLKSLECRTVNHGAHIERILSGNSTTLQRVRLGQEGYVVDEYRRSRFGFLDHVPQPMDSFYKSAYSLENYPQLRELSLHGLNLDMLRPGSIAQALLFCKLERLTLESCSNSAELLDAVAETFDLLASAAPDVSQDRVSPALKHFVFRSENPTTALKDSIVHFLSSFRGLETLSLLFENATFLERPATLIADHGPTIRSLVMEARMQPREHLSLDTSRPFGVGGYSQELWGEAINDIARLCPNLEELGTGFPWNDEIVRLRKTMLPTLKYLKTIHVRNFPENQVFSQVGDYTIKEYAAKFVEWVFPALVGGDRPALEHLAVGPTVYESRWKMTPTSSGPGRMQSQQRLPPEYLRTHHFALDWAKTRFGRWSPLVSPVSEKCMEEVYERKPLGGVFEQVWLR